MNNERLEKIAAALESTPSQSWQATVDLRWIVLDDGVRALQQKHVRTCDVMKMLLCPEVEVLTRWQNVPWVNDDS